MNNLTLLKSSQQLHYENLIKRIMKIEVPRKSEELKNEEKKLSRSMRDESLNLSTMITR